MRVTAVTIATVLLGVQLGAHTAEARGLTAPGALSLWDLTVIALLTLSGLLYVRGVARMQSRGAVQPLRERVAFGCGWTVLVLTVMPPIDALAVELFSVHMIQHELMMLAGAPLVIAGRPLSTCLWGLPGHWRGPAGAAVRIRPILSAWRLLTAPLVAWAVHGVVLWVWHAPLLYNATVRNEGIHALQHAMFVGSAALFWWGLLYGRYGRAGYGAAVFYVFTTVVHTGLLGAMLTFAGMPLYAAYAAPAARRGVDALADQQVAGLLMWIPAGIVLTLLGIGLFSAWIGESERRGRPLVIRNRPGRAGG
jgi:putative membrane protein